MGSYILKVYILFLFINSLLKIKYQNLIMIVVTIFSSVLLIISGDRTPLVLMFIFLILISFLSKLNSINLWLVLILLILTSVFILSNELTKNRLVKMTYSGFVTTLEKFDQDKIGSKLDVNIKENKEIKYFISDDHHSHFLSAKKIF